MVMTPAVERMSLDSVRIRASTGKAVMDMATPTCVVGWLLLGWDVCVCVCVCWGGGVGCWVWVVVVGL
jgi:hypothetical protein